MRYLALDTETGGLTPAKSDLLTAFFIVLDEELYPTGDWLDLKLKPAGNLPVRADPGALAVNKINLAKHVQEAITYEEGQSGLVKLVEANKPADRKLVVVGQNVPFDLKFIQAYLMRPLQWYQWCDQEVVDTYKLAQRLRGRGLLPGIPDLKLETMANYLGIPQASAHNARNDTLMTVLVLRELRRIEKTANLTLS